MFARPLDATTALHLALPAHAPELFALTDANREHLRAWLPWVDHVKTVADTTAFLRDRLHAFADDRGLCLLIKHDGKIAGTIGFNNLDLAHRTASIGYWLDAASTGRGLMTAAVRELTALGFDHYGLRRIEIRCATINLRSRAIPERLGYTLEGVLRQAEHVNGRTFDHAVYAQVFPNTPPHSA
jgi:ribosomal-protein-serine acetyltransferase